MWWSLVATTWSQSPVASAVEIPAATAAPPPTASEPPSQKSFCTSTMINALRMASSDDGHREGRVAGRELEPLPRDRDEALAQVLARVLQRRHALAGQAAAGERPLQGPVVRLRLGDAGRHDHLLGRGAGRLVPAERRLAAAHRRLVR